ncbi:hypothetical protein [Pedobacter cryoconitis]|uniref:Uncharacterized protein n=1 Tax=Pedobacter cryoconitis TaxID=188932 RepID=A0A327SXF1_9SPHI|nr:hypothetical protein [Pedobacter cryoconitis]RAJ32153.1 hypothetical protein LY11_01834 [Pedobacter cryoconitis]
MKFSLLIGITIFISLNTYASLSDKTDTLHIDLDKDSIKDIVIFDRKYATLICKLSTQKFKTITSEDFEFERVSSGINATKRGFEFVNNNMRAGYRSEFAYDKTTKKIQLISMKRYELGPANNDGSGESSIDMLINTYQGSWNYYDDQKDKLIKMPLIRQKMVLPITYLSAYNDAVFFKFQDLCVKIFGQHKAELLRKNKTQTFKKTFINPVGKNTLEVEVFNPCRLNDPPFDAELCTIAARLINDKGDVKFFYDYPDAKMSLIYLDPKEITMQKVNESGTVLIPFYYCGNSEDYERKVSYIIFYKNLPYLCHLGYDCQYSGDCKLQPEQVSGVNILPLVLQKYFLQYANAKHRQKESFHQD